MLGTQLAAQLLTRRALARPHHVKSVWNAGYENIKEAKEICAQIDRLTNALLLRSPHEAAAVQLQLLELSKLKADYEKVTGEEY